MIDINNDEIRSQKNSPFNLYIIMKERVGGRERAVHRCHQNVIKRTLAAAGMVKKRGGGSIQAREGGIHRHKLNVGMPISLGIYARFTTGYGFEGCAI